MASRSRPGEGGRKIIRAPLVLILDRIILWGLLANSQKESGPRISTSDLIVCPRRKGKRLEKTKQAFLIKREVPLSFLSPSFLRNFLFSFPCLLPSRTITGGGGRRKGGGGKEERVESGSPSVPLLLPPLE